MRIIKVENAELMETLAFEVARLNITDAAIVSLIGAVDSFTISTMPAGDASGDVLTSYDAPAELSGTGEIVDGAVHIHPVMALAGDRAVAGHLHRADVRTHFVHVYVAQI